MGVGLRAATVPLALLGSGALVLQASSAAFSGSTTNPGNTWEVGQVTLSDDDGGSSPTTGTAMFTATKLKPGSAGERCIAVTSQSTTSATLKMYVTNVVTTKSVSSHLDVTVDEGTGGSFGSCAGFVPAGKIFQGTLAGFAANGDYATAVGAYALSGTPPESRTYRITYTLSATAPDTIAAGTAGATFVWEARS